MPNTLGLLKTTDVIAFAQNYGIRRNYATEQLFPATKTANIEAEMYRLQQNGDLPTLAKVHALDTEAAIGTRPGLEKINIEKFYVKEKINQSEKTKAMKNHGADESGLISYVYDDMNNLGNAVLARIEKMRTDLLTTGTIPIVENGLNFTIDYGVPVGNKVSADWGDPEHDILGDIQAWVTIAKDGGAVPTRVLTSDKVVSYMQKNKAIQTAINSANGVGTFVSVAQVKTLMMNMFGLTIFTDEDKYASVSVSAGVETRTQQRFFADNKFVILGGVTGKGLFGVTPEEDAYGIGWEKRMNMFLAFAQWETPDPITLWTKAAGMYVPVLANPNGHVIADISFSGEERLDTLTVTSSAGTATGDTAITVSPSAASGNTYRYKVATDAKLPNYKQVLNTWSVWDGTSDITAATGKEICIAEVNGANQALKAGIATVTAKA